MPVVKVLTETEGPRGAEESGEDPDWPTAVIKACGFPLLIFHISLFHEHHTGYICETFLKGSFGSRG